MKKIWLIATTTYKQGVRSGSFKILTLILPALMIIVGAIAVVSSGGDAPSAVGLVDQTGQLAEVPQINMADQTLRIMSFDSPQAAQSSYEQGDIGGYLVLPPDYFEGQEARYYGAEPPGDALSASLRQFMRRAMLPDAPAWALERLEDPSHNRYVALGSGQTIQEGPGFILRIMLPIALAITLALALLFTTSQMGSAIVREKEQRALEMVITSIKPSQLVSGKVLGMSMISLTQIAIWALVALAGLIVLLARDVSLAGLSVPWHVIFWAVALGVPAYLLFAVLAAGLGIIAGDSQQARQLAGFLGFVSMVPLWFAGVLVQAPNSATAVALSLFPLTAPIFTLMRMAVTDVPLWQPPAALAILVLCLLAGIWTVSRIFRAAMLSYGQTVNPRTLITALRQS